MKQICDVLNASWHNEAGVPKGIWLAGVKENQTSITFSSSEPVPANFALNMTAIRCAIAFYLAVSGVAIMKKE